MAVNGVNNKGNGESGCQYSCSQGHVSSPPRHLDMFFSAWVGMAIIPPWHLDMFSSAWVGMAIIPPRHLDMFSSAWVGMTIIPPRHLDTWMSALCISRNGYNIQMVWCTCIAWIMKTNKTMHINIIVISNTATHGRVCVTRCGILYMYISDSVGNLLIRV